MASWRARSSATTATWLAVTAALLSARYPSRLVRRLLEHLAYSPHCNVQELSSTGKLQRSAREASQEELAFW